MLCTKESNFTWQHSAVLSVIRTVFIICCIFLGAGDTHAQITNPPTIALTQQFGGFSQPVHITHAGDGSGRLFVVEQPGRIRVVRNGVVLQEPLLDISATSPEPLARRVLFGGEQGLLSMAFPPGFAGKNYFYVYYTNMDGNNVVARYSLSANPDVANPLSEEMVLVLNHPTFAFHNGGQIAFGPEGFLYIAPGDGNGGCDALNNAQNPLSLLGKMLRIDVESPVIPPATYNVPSTNPFAGIPGFQPEIWALGLRNPWRFSFDRITGDLYIADVGQNAFEEVNVALAPRPGGENYGWNVMEGFQCSNLPPSSCPVACDQSGLTLPVAEYDHTLGCSVTGGFVYRGADYPRMQGIYFYGDFCSGRIWGLRRQGLLWENDLLLDTPHLISSFGEDEAGNMYLADRSTGDVLIITDQVFDDVPFGFWAHQYINAIFNSGITAGCDAVNYCPDDPITRAQMAVFIETSLGVTIAPPCTGTVFGDVNAGTVGAATCGYIERFAADGITAGCGGGNYCPFDPVTRAQMSVFIEAALGNPPNACTGVFGDVSAASVGAATCGFIERLAADGITAGCGGGNYCPFDPVTRAQMAVFIVAAPAPLLP